MLKLTEMFEESNILLLDNLEDILLWDGFGVPGLAAASVVPAFSPSPL